ncbi:hypothetical protein AB0M36_06860 [Actinoplanes sp. NPDC051346]|uniref:hypothetical protein n=1 Tax=Actinoplanes sp. NPDC051346 TaxID=3155048 RepID=UPI00342D30A2
MPLTPEQAAARKSVAEALDAARVAERRRAAAAAEPAGQDRDARLTDATAALDQARITVAENQRRVVGKGTGAETLERDLPVLLLPVRLEARLAWGGPGRWTFDDPHDGSVRHLLARVVPDTIHTDAHEPALTDAEAAAAVAYRKLAHTDARAAWARLGAEVGADRAIWVSRQDPATAARRPPGWTRQVVARLMPDRWQVTVDLDGADGPRRTSALGAVCPDPVPLTADPLAPRTNPLDWVTDFAVAVERGLGVVVPLVDASGTALPGKPVRVTALGVVARLDPGTAAGVLADLVDAHHMTTGMRFPMPGDPTTSSALGRAVTARRTAITGDVLAAERQRYEGAPEHSAPDLRSRIDRVATALGTRRLPWRVLPGATDAVTNAERDLRYVVAAAIRPALTELVEPGYADAALRQYVERIEATGPLPVVLVGAQPYGLLPVLPQIDREPSDPMLSTVEAVRRAWWEPALDRIPRLGVPGRDSTTQLLGALGRDGTPYGFGSRVCAGGPIAAALAGDGGTDPLPPLEAAFGPAAAARFAGLRDLLMHAGTAPLDAELTVLDRRDAGGPLLRPADYLLPLALRPLPEVILQTPGLPTGTAAPLLYQLARAALVAVIDGEVRALAQTRGFPPESLPGWTTPVSEFLTEDTWVAADRTGLGYDAWRTVLDVLQVDPPTDIIAMRNTIGGLSALSPALLQALLRHVLGLATRIDPWYTAAAWERLIFLRTDRPPAGSAVRPGIHIGGFGVLEGFLPRNPVSGPAGYVHAPGAAQAITAAVLHAAHRQRHRDATGLAAPEAAAVRGSAAVRLDSAALRAAGELLDGLREGRPLGELLGARLEERLIARNRPTLIAPVRHSFPSAQGPSAPGAVADGLTLLEAAGFPAAPVPPGGISTDPAALADLTAAIAGTAADLDALADLLLAEGVHQLTVGRYGRSAGVADFAAAARTSVPVPLLPGTDRSATGRPVRVLLLLAATPAGTATAAGWPATPRSAAAPVLADWVAAALPSTADIGLWADLPEHDGAPAASQVFRLNELFSGLPADDPRRFGPLELAAAEAAVAPGSALHARLTALTSRAAGRPAVPALDHSGGLGATELTVVQAVRAAARPARVLGSGRPLTAADLVRAGTDPGASGVTAEPVTPISTRARAAVAEMIAAGAAAASAATRTAAARGMRSASPSDLAELVDTLLRADLAGIRVAVPDTEAGLRAALTAAATEAARRGAALPAEPGSAAPDDALLGWAQATVDAVYGSGLPLGATITATGHPLTAATPTADPAVRSWLARAAAVRPQVRNLHLADLVAGARPGGAAARPRAVRLPAGGWTPAPGAPGTVDLIALVPVGGLPGPLTGLVIDEWTETVPAPAVDTAVTFHQPAPTAAPPQTLLIAVPPPNLEQWSIAALADTVDEALRLARLRATDLTDVGPNQLLPALLSSSEPPGPTASPAPPDGLAPTGLIGG